MPEPDSLYQLPTLVRREMRRLASLLLFEILAAALLANVVYTQSLALRWGGRATFFGRPLLHLSAYPSWPALAVAVLATFLVLLALLRRPLARLPLLSLLVLPTYAALGPLYPPLGYLHWPRALRQQPALAPALHQALVLATGYAALSALLTLVSYLALRNALEESGDTHGSARWATAEEISEMGLDDAERRSKQSAHSLLVGLLLHTLYAEKEKTSPMPRTSSPTPSALSRGWSRPTTTPAERWAGWTRMASRPSPIRSSPTPPALSWSRTTAPARASSPRP